MKAKFLTIVILTLFCLSNYAQSTWQNAIGRNGIDIGYSIKQTNDKGFVVGGATDSLLIGNNDFYINKLDFDGNLQWNRIIGGGGNEECHSVIQAKDGGYVMCGFTNSFGAGKYDVYIVKLDSLGNLQWTKTIGGIQDDKGYSIIQTNDGGYALCGSTYSYGVAMENVYVMKLDGSGSLQWARAIGGYDSDESESFCIIQTPDGGYALSGQTNSFGQGSWDVYILKLDSSGFINWTRTLGDKGPNCGFSIIQTLDNGFAVCGWTYSSRYCLTS